MDPGLLDMFKSRDFLFLALVSAVAAGTAFAVFLFCYFWFRREQRRLQSRILATVIHSEGMLETRPPRSGELVAQFRAKQGRQVISVLEADGKRFLHIDGEISAPERAKMVRYLKSEGFMS